MAPSIELGIPGVELSPGDHICAFYAGEQERDDILLPYLRAGLRAGEKCIAVVDSSEPDVVLGRIGNGEVPGYVASGQLDVCASRDAYYRSGEFSTDEMIEFWERSLAEAIGGGTYRFARAVGEMTWSLRDLPGVDQLVDYESQLNHFLPRYPQVILCLYDLGRFTGELVIDLIKTHPKMLLGGMILENPHYLTPEEFRAIRV